MFKTCLSLAAVIVAAIALFAQSIEKEIQNTEKPGRRFSTIQRLAPAHLEAVHQARLRLARERVAIPRHGQYQDFRAVFHVHAEDAPHTLGTRLEVLAAAHQANVQIVGFSDHNGAKPETWRGLRDGILFIPGAEFGAEHLLTMSMDGQELRFLSHVEELPGAPMDGFTGLEIYNRHTDAKDEPEFNQYLRAALKDPDRRRTLAETVMKYPDEVFAAGTDYWPGIFAKWDRDLRTHHLTGIAANDAHHNQVFENIDFDPYAVSFRSVTTHVLARSLKDADVKEALAAGCMSRTIGSRSRTDSDSAAPSAKRSLRWVIPWPQVTAPIYARLFLCARTCA